MIVEAKCLYKAFDNHTGREYFPGFVSDFDTDNSRLTSLTTPKGDWVFQYPGHQGSASEAKKEVVSVTASQVPVPSEAKKPKGRPMSDAHKAKMAAGRAARKAKLEAEAA